MNTSEKSLYNLLQSNPIFSNVDRYSFSLIEDYLFFRGLQQGDYLFHEGDHGDFMAFVVAGQLAILKIDENGNESQLAVKDVGESVGDMSIIDNLTRSANTKAIEKTALIILPKADFERILNDHPETGIKMMKGIANTLSLTIRQSSIKLAKAKQENIQLKNAKRYTPTENQESFPN